MNLQFLKYFSVLAEELHFGRAAARLAISQPPLSTAIKSLEDELGVKLFIRNSKMVQLTQAGAGFLVEARQILERVSRAKSVAQALDSGLSGRLDIAFGAPMIYREVLPVLDKFAREMPGIDIVLSEMPTVEQFERMVRGQLHAGFTHGAAAPAPLKFIPLKRDVYFLCLPESHPMATQAVVNLQDLADDHFILFSRAPGPANYDNVIAIFSRAGIHPRIVHEARAMLTIMAMVAQGRGVALLPSSMAKAGMRGVRFVPFSGSPAPAPGMLVWNPTLQVPALTKFIASATQTIKPKQGRS